MSHAAYDAIVDDYAAFVGTHLAEATSVLGVATRGLLDLAGPVAGLAVCDLGCGEGHLARYLAGQGSQVVGVDISAALLQLARARSGPDVRFVQDDAQQLRTLPDGAFDLMVSNLALMDIPDLAATYAAVQRVLRPGGRFVFAVTHPCFQAPGTRIETDAAGNFQARAVARYTEEGFWRSANPAGIRGKVGAYHRTLATYLNKLLAAGFMLTRLAEPAPPPGVYSDPYTQAQVQVPAVLVVEAGRP
jgi:SAM-dependent methyltransferase